MIFNPTNWTRERFRRRLVEKRARELEIAAKDPDAETSMGGELPHCSRCGRRMAWNPDLRAHACPHDE